MPRFTRIFQPLIRSVLFVSAITMSSVQAADKIDLIIDTDPGADDVVALLLALASPEQLQVRAITTVAGNVRLDKTSRNARLAREWAGREDVPVYAGAPKPWCVRRFTPRTFTARKASPVCLCMSRPKVSKRPMRSITWLIPCVQLSQAA